MEREWLIEQFVSEAMWQHDLAWMVETLDRYKSYYVGESLGNPWQNPPESRQRNRHKNIEALRKARVHVVTRSYYRPWVPIYLFQPRPVEWGNSFYYGEVDQLVRTLESRIERVAPRIVPSPPYLTTLDRCVILYSDVTQILKNYQLRIRNWFTDEVIPCEIFG